ncbi:hypothetical protein D8674_006656 [Pyrus ussuriensis x Pyrus communis]|uniref:Uncharacterized protein n=1 Tax=Pyrus ussuriensis x Pyrus communis TaxID=2448454 RepID=A0A5N5FV03_9ROSA|nr:hypothetical protein D8674_006656 [Pyrus ussuriensis x Pyrus communis]
MRPATMDFFNDMEDHGSTMAMEAQTQSQLRRPARLPQQSPQLEVPHNSPLAAKTKIQTPENFNNSSIGEEKTCKFEVNADLEDEDEDEEEDYEEEEEEDEKSNGIVRGRGFET